MINCYAVTPCLKKKKKEKTKGENELVKTLNFLVLVS